MSEEPTIAERIASVFRDYAVDGVPASGPHEPDKADIRELLEDILAEGGDGGGGGEPEPEPIPLVPWTANINIDPPAQADEVLLRVKLAEDVTLPAGLSGTQCEDVTAPAAAQTYTLKKNGTQCGTIVFNTDGTFTKATASNAVVALVVGDVLTLHGPASPDEDAVCSFTLKGDR